MSNSVSNVFGPRALEYFKAAKNKTWIQNADGSPNKVNIASIGKHDIPLDKGKNAFGGKVDIKL